MLQISTKSTHCTTTYAAHADTEPCGREPEKAQTNILKRESERAPTVREIAMCC